MWKSGKLEVGWGFAAMLALALLAGAGEVLPLVGLSALCHELGHLGALRLAGAEVECFRLSAFGAEIQADTRYLPYPKEILCTLAGPAVNLLLALVFSRVAGDYVTMSWRGPTCCWACSTCCRSPLWTAGGHCICW